MTYIPNRSATPGKYQTGSTAALLTFISTPGYASLCVPSAFASGAVCNTIFPSTCTSPFLAASSISLNFICALVTLILGLISNPSSSICFLNTCGARCPQGSKLTILLGSDHDGWGGIGKGGSVWE